MRQAARRDTFETFLWGEVVLVALLGAALALFLSKPSLRQPYDLPQLRLILSTLYAAGAGLVALLTATRFSIEGRRFDLVLCGGFSAISLTWFTFALVPAIAERPWGPDSWANLVGVVTGWSVIACAPFVRGRIERRRAALVELFAFLAADLACIWAISHGLVHDVLPQVRNAALALLALLNLVAAIGFGDRFRRYGEDLDRWLALGATLTLFASLDFLFGPLVGSSAVTQGDFSAAFLVVAAVSALSIFYFIPLPKDAGASLTARKPDLDDPRSEVPPD